MHLQLQAAATLCFSQPMASWAKIHTCKKQSGLDCTGTFCLYVAFPFVFHTLSPAEPSNIHTCKKNRTIFTDHWLITSIIDCYHMTQVHWVLRYEPFQPKVQRHWWWCGCGAWRLWGGFLWQFRGCYYMIAPCRCILQSVGKSEESWTWSLRRN